MSSLLEQAIVDAKALKEAAMKNAEATIIDKYSEEVKSTLSQLLEQDELSDALAGLGGEEEPDADAEATMDEEVEKDEIAEGVPDAFTEDVAELDGVNEGDDAQVTIDFKELAEALNQLREGVEEEETLEESEDVEEEPMDEEIELDEESIMEMVSSMLSEEDEETLEEAEEDDDVMEEGEEDGDLYEELSDALLEAIMEKLTVDMGATLSGWAGRSDDDMKHQMELEMAHRRSTDVAEELEALKKAQEELVFENKKLKQNLSNYQEVVNSLKENVQDVNLSNARLLYTNRTLRNISLNERQK